MSGIFGVVSEEDCSELLFYGTDYHSHMGTEFGGLAVFGKDGITRKIHDIRSVQFKSIFYDDYKKMKGKYGIGVISAQEEQPIYLNSKFGPLAICTNGRIGNLDRLVAVLHKKGISFSEVYEGSVNPTEVVSKLINQGKSIVDGIESAQSKIDGSCSILLLNSEGIYAARDRLGYSPLVIGRKEGFWAVTSETAAFPNLGFEVEKYLKPGEIVLVNERGPKQKRVGSTTNHICAFLWIYTGFPASSYEGINVEKVRMRCGAALARRDCVEADIVAGVPDSGTAHAVGYANESKIPFARPLIKYTDGWGRSYTPPSQEVRDIVATMKLDPINDLIKGNKIILCDDSIIRGTQLGNSTLQKLWKNGAVEVHVRVACPPLMWPCKYNVSTRSIEELAARKAIEVLEGRDVENVSEYLDPDSEKYKRMVEEIREEIGATSLRYQRLDDMVEAIGIPKEDLCLYCWTGESPKSHHIRLSSF